MTRRHCFRTILPTLGLLLLGGGAVAHNPGTDLVLLDSLVLGETDELYSDGPRRVQESGGVDFEGGSSVA